VVRSFDNCARTDSLHLFPDASRPTLIDLSKATKLKDVAFLLTSWSSVEWIAMAFQTITPKHQDVQQISIHIPYYLAIDGADANIRGTIGEADYRQWLNLDRLLVRFWKSRLIQPKVIWITETGGDRNIRDCLECLLPEVTGGGMVGLIEHVFQDWFTMYRENAQGSL
jgi:hypothetical protein